MTLYATELQRFGLKKESSRGTAEASPTKWYPTRGIPTFDYSLKHLSDDGIRGLASKFPPFAGIKVGDGKIPLYCDAQMLGEIFYSLLGSVSSAQQGVTAAYKHTFTKLAGIQHQAYTFFQDRSLNVLKYNLGVVKKVSLKGSVDGLIDAEADVMFKSEASGSIGSPSFPTNQYLGFQHVTFNVAGGQETECKDWELDIDNGSVFHRTLAGSQDVTDILTPHKLAISGGFTVYFQSTTERDKFMANTDVALEMLAVGSTIASTYKYTVDVNIYKARYVAYPYGEDQGLLAAKVKFEGFYDTSSSKDIQVDITNTDTSY